MPSLRGATAAQIASALGATLLSTVIVWAASGNGTEELRLLVSLRWGVVSLVDLYLGFSLFSMWIWFREARRVVAAAWTGACAAFVLVLALACERNGTERGSL